MSRGRLEVRQEPHLLEGVLRERLGLVDDEQHPATVAFLLEEEAVQLGHQRTSTETLGGQAELGADRLQELERAATGIEEEGQLDVAFESLEERATQGGLAGADLARDRDEALALLDAVEQVRQCLAVRAGEVQKPWIGAQREGFFTQAVKRGIHRAGFRTGSLTD